MYLWDLAKTNMNFTFKNIPDMFYRVCDRYDDKVAFRFKENGKWQDLTYSRLVELVESFALALLELGIRKGDRVGFVSENRIEWIISNFAVSLIGAVDVPIFPILTAKQEEYIFSNCGVSCLIVSNNFQLNKVMQFKDDLETLRQIIVLNDDFTTQDPAVRSYKDMVARGLELRPNHGREYFDKKINKIASDDLLTLIYTSGTTGDPKGVMLTHGNLCSNIKDANAVFGNLEQHTTLLFLPLCHAYERTSGFYTLFSGGAQINMAESIDVVASNLREVSPTIMTSVPKLLETIKKKIFHAMSKETPSKQKVFNWAVEVGSKYVRNKLDGKNSITLKAQYKIADKLVFSKLRDRVGGRLNRIISGGAALADDVYEFFMAMGVNVQQGYGLTEASPVVAVNRIDNIEIGTIGTPFNSVEVKIAEDGEILVKGPNVMKGYWNDIAATKEAIDSDGWLHTGDVGQFTKKGNLKITDRKKYIFVNSGGKNIAPQPIENVLAQSRYIDHCMLIGDMREYITALITPDFVQLKELAEEFGITYSNETELISNDRIVKHIKKEIDYLQKDFAKFERIRKFSLLSKPFTVEDGELSPKMSVKRHVVEQKYSDMIDDMYKGS